MRHSALTALIFSQYLLRTRTQLQSSGTRNRVSNVEGIFDYETRLRVPFASLTEYEKKNTQKGFTLIEMVTVIVILSILSVIGGSFMIRSAESYYQSVNRGKLVQKGRAAIEQMTRQLRISVPNSVRVSGNNLCIEWLPVVAGGNYLGELPDQDNGATAVSTINTAPLSFDLGSPHYVTVGGLSSTEFYNAVPASLEIYASVNSSAIPNIITLGTPKQFLRNSINQRVFVADRPMQFCVSGTNLTQHEGYTVVGTYPSAAALTGAPPNTGILLSDGIALNGETPFAIVAGTEARNTIVNIELPFSEGGEGIVLRHQVMVRNVP